MVVDPRTPPPRDIPAVSAAHFAGGRGGDRAPDPAGPPAHRRRRRTRRTGSPAKSRLAGHTSALADVGVLADPALVRSAEPTVEFGRCAAGELLDRPDRPTAIVGFNDKVAVGALAAAAERGLRVPGDVSVTGFDDIDLAQATSPRLTTVRQPLGEMGRMAVSLLIRLLEHQQVEALHVELATELVVRDSTGRPSIDIQPATAR